MEKHIQLPIPTTAWDRKTYNPILLFRRWIYKHWRYSWLDKSMDKFIFDPYNNLKQGIINFWNWKSVIYKDRNWDDHFIFEVLKRKLILQRKELVQANRHTLVAQTNRDITICLNLIERIQAEFYEMEYMDYHKSEFNFKPSTTHPDCSTLEIKEISEDFDSYFKKYRNTSKRCLKKDRNLCFNKKRLAMMVSLENQKRCQSLLFKILEERITWWWD